MNKQDIVPPIIIKNAAGLFKAVSGAPFKIIPTKTDMIPITKPMTVASSKVNPPITAHSFIYLFAIPLFNPQKNLGKHSLPTTVSLYTKTNKKQSRNTGINT